MATDWSYNDRDESDIVDQQFASKGRTTILFVTTLLTAAAICGGYAYVHWPKAGIAISHILDKADGNNQTVEAPEKPNPLQRLFNPKPAQ